MFGYLASSCFMYPIQEFWLVALAAADRIAIWPLPPISLASRLTSDVPICWVFAWLMNRWSGELPQVTSESKDTILIPARAAWFSDGHSADGSLPAMTMALACAWIAAWIEGICADAVSAVPPVGLDDDPELLHAAAVMPAAVNTRAEKTFLRSVLVMVIAVSPLVSCRNLTRTWARGRGRVLS